MKDKFKNNNNQNLLSLNYKIEIPEKGNFFISSYNKKYITVNKIKFYLPLCLLGKQFYDLKIKNILMISSNFLLKKSLSPEEIIFSSSISNIFS